MLTRIDTFGNLLTAKGINWAGITFFYLIIRRKGTFFDVKQENPPIETKVRSVYVIYLS
jgi:hypothetical protein